VPYTTSAVSPFKLIVVLYVVILYRAKESYIRESFFKTHIKLLEAKQVSTQ